MHFPSSVSGRTRSKSDRILRELKFRGSPPSVKKEGGLDPGSLGKARGTENNPIFLECGSEESGSEEGSSDEVNGLTDSDDEVIICGESKRCEEDEELERWNKESKQLPGANWWEAKSDDDEEQKKLQSKKTKKSATKKTEENNQKSKQQTKKKSDDDEEQKKLQSKKTKKSAIKKTKEENQKSKPQTKKNSGIKKTEKRGQKRQTVLSESDDTDKEEQKRRQQQTKKKKSGIKITNKRGRESQRISSDSDTDKEEVQKKKKQQMKKTNKRGWKRLRLLSESDDDRDFPETFNEKRTEKEQERKYMCSSSSGSALDELERKTSVCSNDDREKMSSECGNEIDMDSTSETFSEKPADEEENTSTSFTMSETESDEIEKKSPVRRMNRMGKQKIAGQPVSSQKKTGEKKAERRKKSSKVVDTLLKLMSVNGKERVEELNSEEKEKVDDLPSKFFFTDKEEDPPEKLEAENELDEIWKEFSLALQSEMVGSSTSNKEECESETELDQDMLCKMGIHSTDTPIVDEEFGLICPHCGEVTVKSKDMMPELVMKPKRSEQADFRGYPRDGGKLSFDELGEAYADYEPLPYAGLRGCPKTAWDLIPGVREDMYPHQREGFEFIWKHIAGGIECLKRETVESYNGTGCIVSHAPGTGKSRLAISFLQSYMKVNPYCLPVIIAPKSVLLTWEDEFRKWNFDVPFHNLNSTTLSGKEDTQAITVLRRGQGARDTSVVRVVKLFSWKKGGSVLGVNYTTFETMLRLNNDEMGQKLKSILLNSPGLLILDEGHIPRNENSFIWKALSHVKTPKRIILSGTPFQNNFDELYNTMRVVNPKFSVAFAEKGHRKGRRESQVKARKDWATLTKPLNNEAGSSAEAKRLKDIKALIDPFVHVHRGHVLEKSLPGIRESIIELKPFELQRTLLQEISTTKMETLQHESAVALVSIHPSLIPDSLKATPPMSRTILDVDLKSLRSKPLSGVKTWFLINLIRFCCNDDYKERVLVFSQYLQPLSLAIEHMKSEFGWSENKEILYIDGNRHMEERQAAINSMNDPKSEARVMLVSTKAGGEGINLVGASRVVLLDVVWNPSVERQATRRAYRLGQKRFVHVYHLVASGTIEEKKCSRQANKDRMSNLVFASSSATEELKSRRKVAEDKVLDTMVEHPHLKDIFHKISIKNDDLDVVEEQI